MTAAGWTLLFHDCILRQLGKLAEASARAMAAHPETWHRNDNVRVFAAIAKLTLEDIPGRPGNPKYRQDDELGREYRHWFRAKFHKRFRLFYRYDSRSRIIVYAWVNDERSLRKAGSRTDPYRLFRRMLRSGDPPDEWNRLVRSAKPLPNDLKTLAKRIR
ncbi:MAG TPA: type II toxin-antitoxin system YhaV family toxin [Kiloniellales bacterium]|nr:type II toxin-antitoxin system YhaV family toxin [Kiloniellales bacterium]